jgi:hypothetical protein
MKNVLRNYDDDDDGEEAEEAARSQILWLIVYVKFYNFRWELEHEEFATELHISPLSYERISSSSNASALYLGDANFKSQPAHSLD